MNLPSCLFFFFPLKKKKETGRQVHIFSPIESVAFNRGNKKGLLAQLVRAHP